MENNSLNKNSADKQDTPAPYLNRTKNKTKNQAEFDTNKNLTNTPAQHIGKGDSFSDNKNSKNHDNAPHKNKDTKLKTTNYVIDSSQNAENSELTASVDQKKTKQKDKSKPNKQNKQKKPKAWVWIVKVFVLAVGLSLAFSLLSEFTLSKTNIVVSVIVILVFIAVSIVFDMLGLAVASCQLEPFTAMAARKVPGSKLAINLIKNADKVSAICCDVIGDVCGILAGAGGASILTKIAIKSTGFMPIFVASLISAIIAGLTIGGKASFKRLARAKSNPITLKFAQVLNLFVHKK